jgi:NADPH:quinone reductase-like Zn-dependent oxidoreductase
MKHREPFNMSLDGGDLICRQCRGVDELTVGEVPVPEPAPGEVLIRVKATAVNWPDSIMVATAPDEVTGWGAASL